MRFYCLFLLCSLLAVSAKKPNIIVILTDDQRPDTLSAYNENCPIKTPNIDALAEKGTKFDRAYVTTPICSVSRGNIFTGMYSRKNMVQHFVQAPSDEIFEKFFQIQLKKKAGYTIGQIGKYGILCPEPQRKQFDFWAASGGQGEAFKTVNGKKVHDAEWITMKTNDFLNSHDQEKPFCLQLNYKEPHPSSVPAPEDENTLDSITLPRDPLDTAEYNQHLPRHVRETLGSVDYETRMKSEEGYQEFAKNYFEKVISVDRSVGAVIESLKSRNLYENTVFIFLSDHGTALGKRQMGGKWTPYEENLKIPFILFDPRNKTTKSETSALALSIDVAPTVLALGGVEAPEEYDGKSLLPITHGKEDSIRDGFSFEYFCSPLGVRYLARYEGYMSDRYKYVRWYDHNVLPIDPSESEHFFDLQTDPTEKKNAEDKSEEWNQHKNALQQWERVYPRTFSFNTYRGRAQTLTPDIDWELFKKHRPGLYGRIAKAVEELGVTWDQAKYDWKVRQAVSRKSKLWY